MDWSLPFSEVFMDQENQDPGLFAQENTGSSKGFLMYASKPLTDAVASASISRAHGMLLAALREEVQVSSLARLLSLDALPGVEDVRQTIQSNAVVLSDAPFDTHDCKNCRYNSTNHANLFSTSIAPGLCVNGLCSHQKWLSEVEGTANKLGSKYRVIRIAVAPDIPDVRSSDAVQPEAVGTEQSAHCKTACEHFGALVGGKPGCSIVVKTDVCMNTKCNDKLQECQRLKSLEESKSRLWRSILTKHARTLPRAQNRAILMAMLSLGCSAGSEIMALCGNADASDPISAWLSLPSESLVAAMGNATAALISTAPTHQIGQMLRALKVNIADYSRMSPEFLRRLSVSEIDEVLSDLKVEASLKTERAKGRGEYAEAVIAILRPEALIGYVPSVFRL